MLTTKDIPPTPAMSPVMNRSQFVLSLCIYACVNPSNKVGSINKTLIKLLKCHKSKLKIGKDRYPK